MQSLSIRSDTLIDIGTFLVRRWSDRNKVVVGIEKNQKEVQTKLQQLRVNMIPIDMYQGDNFQKYRQFRTALWYEGMRIKHCTKILSNDHAYGTILNILETRRIEMIGVREWGGMEEELIFNYGFVWMYRPLLHTILGKARVVEGFAQIFLMGDIKGELPSNQFDKVHRAAEFAKEVVKDAIQRNLGTEWLEKKIPEILKILELDALMSIPISSPKTGAGLGATKQELLKTFAKIAENRKNDFGKVDPESVYKGEAVAEEFKTLVQENKKNENLGPGTQQIGISTPESMNVDESGIYDLELINRLKARFKNWKTGWKERLVISGEEFDEEVYAEGGNRPFITDRKMTIKTRIAILLDHSSSITGNELEYKKTTLALCEVLAYLKIKFSVYAFSTEKREVKCWLVKPENIPWSNIAAKRLAQIRANGGTPLAEVYNLMFPILKTKKPHIFLTLTDGEPSDPDATKSMVKTFKLLGIKMVAIGVGRDITDSTQIASNLKHLGYERTLAVSRPYDIPKKVLNVLSAN